MNAEDRERFGELIGTVKALSEQVTDLQRSTKHSYETIATELGSIKESLTTKVPEPRIKAAEDRIDSLESDRDKRAGSARVVGIARGAALAVIPTLIYVLASSFHIP